MKERPILFSGEMVRAILADTKTQTRRVVKPLPPSTDAVRAKSGSDFSIFAGTSGDVFRVAGPVWAIRDIMGREPEWPCPYGQPGDRLWVRETWAEEGLRGAAGYVYAADGTRGHFGGDGEGGRLFCPHGWTLGVTPTTWPDGSERIGRWYAPPTRWRPSIHMPRLAARLTLEVTDVRVERLQDITEEDARAEGVTPAPFCKSGRPARQEHVEAFESLWREINGAESWGANPWVWVVSFKRINAGTGV